MIIFYSNEVLNHSAILTEDESLHCSKVLRKKVEDEVFVTDGNGSLFKGNISDILRSNHTIAPLPSHLPKTSIDSNGFWKNQPK